MRIVSLTGTVVRPRRSVSQTITCVVPGVKSFHYTGTFTCAMFPGFRTPPQSA
jgi:hypothetical protein